jgi:hypothetical protein
MYRETEASSPPKLALERVALMNAAMMERALKVAAALTTEYICR